MNRISRELFNAAREENQNLVEVRRLLRAGANVNYKGSLGKTPLHCACNRGHVQVVNELRGHGTFIEAKDNHGGTPLHVAAMWGHFAVVNEVRGHGTFTEAKDNDGCTPLHLACHKGHLAVVNELLSPTDSNGTTPSTIGERKSRGVDIEAKTNGGNTPLHFSSYRGHLAVVKALLSGGANILVANNEGELPIHEAVDYEKSAVSKCLLQQLYTITHHLPLHELLNDLTWIGNPENSDVPPLHEALHRNVLGTDDAVEILEFLVDRNPELISARDQDGALPLHVACRRVVSFPIVQSLVNLYKASVKSVTPEGDLPLFLACEMPETSLDTIFLLIKLYPDLVYR
jgi:ankyrin repeat protein